MNLLNENRNYIIIALLSCAAVFFLPMLGSSVGMTLLIPDTFAGWTVYLITKTCIVVINLLIFDQFMKRAKINAGKNPLFQKAEEIMREMAGKNENEVPAPAQFYIKKMYRSKMLSTAIFTILGVFGFTNAVLTFDWVSMLSYVFTIMMGLIYGWAAMADAEQIWIERHYVYAKYAHENLLMSEANKTAVPTEENGEKEKT